MIASFNLKFIERMAVLRLRLCNVRISASAIVDSIMPHPKNPFAPSFILNDKALNARMRANANIRADM